MRKYLKITCSKGCKKQDLDIQYPISYADCDNAYLLCRACGSKFLLIKEMIEDIKYQGQKEYKAELKSQFKEFIKLFSEE